ncbi:craniofacial development protein 1 [Selaginella moellendorffii]|uniref:craniofacial development protein 1 n=1 Tax=Selaginella moellendorffii TaxID=88036 RepID=UPI000D1C34B0|nr:craniofacial development protein 1 [Selaginella moellendorffii]|eukprot:XP_024519943.1 craniofacial development protein 1 [Selaginella moellendorffii]
MAQVEEKTKASAAWEELRSRDSSLKARAEAVLQRAYGRKDSPAVKPTKSSSSPPGWMISLGMVPKKKDAAEISSTDPPEIDNVSDADREDTRRIAAAALAATRSGAPAPKVVAAAAATAVPPQSDAKSSDAGEKRKLSSGLDNLLEQIQKKPKANILDRSKKDWGEFKDEKGLTEELEAYKKSGDKYLDKVAFLQRADDREYEKERDARLEYQAKRRLGASYQDD